MVLTRGGASYLGPTVLTRGGALYIGPTVLTRGGALYLSPTVLTRGGALYLGPTVLTRGRALYLTPTVLTRGRAMSSPVTLRGQKSSEGAIFLLLFCHAGVVKVRSIGHVESHFGSDGQVADRSFRRRDGSLHQGIAAVRTRRHWKTDEIERIINICK